MKDGVMAGIKCTDCGTEIDPIAHPSECPECGSENRSIHVMDDGKIIGHESVRVKQWEGEKKGKPDKEIRSGDDLHRKTGDWNKLRREIDRTNDRYFEHIEDQEGNVIRHVEEPLSQHHGHGSAKHPRKPSADDA